MGEGMANQRDEKRLAWCECCMILRRVPIHGSTQISPAYAAAGIGFDVFWSASNPPDREQCISRAISMFMKTVRDQKAERDKRMTAHAA